MLKLVTQDKQIKILAKQYAQIMSEYVTDVPIYFYVYVPFCLDLLCA